MAFAGGGGSSSGGGSGGGAMVYTGTEVWTQSAPGSAPFTSRIPITITVTGNMVTITDGDISATAPMSADGMNFIIPVRFL